MISPWKNHPLVGDFQLPCLITRLCPLNPCYWKWLAFLGPDVLTIVDPTQWLKHDARECTLDEWNMRYHWLSNFIRPRHNMDVWICINTRWCIYIYIYILHQQIGLGSSQVDLGHQFSQRASFFLGGQYVRKPCQVHLTGWDIHLRSVGTIHPRWRLCTEGQRSNACRWGAVLKSKLHDWNHGYRDMIWMW